MLLTYAPLVLVLSGVGADTSGEAEVTVQLSPGRLDGCTFHRGTIRLADALPVPGPDAPIVIEAEAADVLAHQAVKRTADGKPWSVQSGAQASGGHYVDWVEYAEYRFRVVRPGPYHRWLRFAVPGLNYNHAESMDQHAVRAETDWTGQGKVVWVWKRGERPYHLSRGDHVFKLHNYYNGARLDKIVLTRQADWKPDGQGPPATPRQRIAVGTVVTRAFQPAAVRRWLTLVVDGDAQGGGVAQSVSVDGGKRWVPVAPGGDLRSVKVAGDGTDHLSVRVELRRAASGRSPTLRGVRVAYRTDPSATVTLGNVHCRIRLNRRTGALLGIENRQTQAAVTPLGQDLPLASLVVKTRGKDDARRLDHTQATCSGVQQPSPGTAVVPLTFLDGRITLRCEIVLGQGPVSAWSCHITNNSPLDIVQFKFPILTDVRIGPDPTDDELILPRHSGMRYANPASRGRQVAKYLGNASMQWLDLYDPAGGVYLAAHDLRLTNMELASTANRVRDAVELALEKFDCIPAGGGQRTWTYSVGVHPGDWHWAADRYREWFAAHFPKPDYPEWLKDCDGYFAFGLMNAQGWRFSQMPLLLDAARSMGLNYVQCWGQFSWWLDGCCSSFFWPSPMYGTAEEFAAANRAIRRAGGHIGYYHLADRINVYNIVTPHIDGLIPKKRYPPDTPMPTEKLFVENHLVQEPDGRIAAWPVAAKDLAAYAKQHDALRKEKKRPRAIKAWRPMRTWSPAWQAYNLRWAIEFYIKRFGVDAMYWDVVAAGPPKESYDRRVNEDGTGLWGLGHLQLLKQVRDQARRLGVHPALGVEGCGDAHGQVAWHMISGFDRHSEIYRYTLPDQICFAGSSNTGHRNPRATLERVHLCGNRFDMGFRHRLARDLIALRRATKAWIYPARFMDTVGLATRGPVQARWFLTDTPTDRAAAVAVVNTTRTPDGRITLDATPFGPVRCAAALGVDGSAAPWPVQQKGSRVEFAAPPAHMSVVVLVSKASGARCDVGRIDYDDSGEHPVMHTRFVRLGPAGKVRLRLHDTPALRCNEAYAEMACEPGRAYEHTSTLRRTPMFSRFVPVRATIESDQGTTRIETMAAPLVVDGSFGYAPADRDPSRYLHGIDATCAADGKQSLRLNPDPDVYVHQARGLYLQPGHTYHVSFKLRKTGRRAKTIGSIVLEYEGLKDIRRHHPLRPTGAADARGWQTYAATITTAKTADRWSIYLYNTFSHETVWFDDIVVLRK